MYDMLIPFHIFQNITLIFLGPSALTLFMNECSKYESALLEALKLNTTAIQL